MKNTKKAKKSAIEINIESPEDTNHINMIVYGLTDAGKTFFCGTAALCAETSPTLFVNIDKGTLTIKRFMQKHGLTAKELAITSPKNFGDIQDIYEYLRYENTKYRSVCLDSLTEFQKGPSMGTILGDLEDDMAYKDLGKSTPANRGDWLRSHEHVRKLIRAFRDLAYLDDESRRLHVIMTALEKEDEKRMIVCPSLPGVLGLECGALVDILGHLSEQENAEGRELRFLRTKSFTNDDGVKFLAKNRGGLLGKGIWKPTVASVVDVWQFNNRSKTGKGVDKKHGKN
jgi:hypothetical protein